MIGQINGVILEKNPPELLVDVAGVGYELNSSMNTFYNLPEIGSRVVLYTHMIVREDVHALYGFYEKDERKLFRELIKTSGVGPKLALTILSGMAVNAFVQLVNIGDSVALTKIPGVGKKTAERLILEMKSRLKKFEIGIQSNIKIDSSETDALNALISLGYKAQSASKAVAKYREQKSLSSEELIKLALRDLS